MTVLVPMTVEQDEDGWWSAHAQLGPNVGANGQGRTRKEALDDLREAVLASFEAESARCAGSCEIVG
jgi:predicted RNase H-like HicB family nuclease